MRSKIIKSKNKIVVLYEDGTVKKNGKLVENKIDPSGYVRVTIGGKRKRLHRWMAEAFLPNPENKKCVNHIDGNKTNNHVSNLEWSTHKENNDHAVEMGLTGRHCETHSQAQLTNKQVLEIVAKWNSGKYKYRSHLAKEYNVDRNVVEKILRGDRWSKLTGIKKP